MSPSTHDHNNPRTGSNQIMWHFYIHFRYVNFEKIWFTYFQSIYHSIIWHISCYFLNPLVLPCWVKWKRNKDVKKPAHWVIVQHYWKLIIVLYTCTLIYPLIFFNVDIRVLNRTQMQITEPTSLRTKWENKQAINLSNSKHSW